MTSFLEKSNEVKNTAVSLEKKIKTQKETSKDDTPQLSLLIQRDNFLALAERNKLLSEMILIQIVLSDLLKKLAQKKDDIHKINMGKAITWLLIISGLLASAGTCAFMLKNMTFVIVLVIMMGTCLIICAILAITIAITYGDFEDKDENNVVVF